MIRGRAAAPVMVTKGSRDVSKKEDLSKTKSSKIKINSWRVSEYVGHPNGWVFFLSSPRHLIRNVVVCPSFGVVIPPVKMLKIAQRPTQ